MDNSKRYKNGAAVEDSGDALEGGTSESSSISETFSDDEISYEVASLSPSNFSDVSTITEQSRIFPSSEEFLSLSACSKVLISGDIIFSFCGFFQLSKVLEIAEKKLKKALNTLVSSLENKEAKKDETYVFYTERAANIPLEMVLDLYKSLSFADFKYIIFISRVKVCGKMEAKDLMEDFKEYDPSDLSHMPVRGEEVLLLSSYISKKQIVVNGNTFRLFLVDNQMFESFINLFSKELSEST
ncbi:hypothetical protein EHEL_041260 [Encephalitozoon hellem ATCC 50504]|uniref:Ribosome biogenesis GTP-binding protein YsxC n=1 Tax=Encephalitozoon hellem TaxID=27973 RepID=A0A9Q9C9M9_ENCHE|nr:uncharacterized protein EHEL_041260 [Encephalitozoon hellem ATCC 50504]AFM98176.1 hypothetical protein EHEL_041260 [Encephalitozoon hellem ATCC 50504]UTX43022.1 hypothetical protein GPU96_04g07550 [Encephalitozoon hellem]WEL38479.1 ribosome biogenesis GTP-binding protein YsxC [Encephalitozoon hellem]|eukprot:XP_003887157.1 hypothetical protein EHEL_041260 [Encephalitozoon hellem ATCC 50504]